MRHDRPVDAARARRSGRERHVALPVVRLRSGPVSGPRRVRGHRPRDRRPGRVGRAAGEFRANLRARRNAAARRSDVGNRAGRRPSRLRPAGPSGRSLRDAWRTLSSRAVRPRRSHSHVDARVRRKRLPGSVARRFGRRSLLRRRIGRALPTPGRSAAGRGRTAHRGRAQCLSRLGSCAAVCASAQSQPHGAHRLSVDQVGGRAPRCAAVHRAERIARCERRGLSPVRRDRPRLRHDVGRHDAPQFIRCRRGLRRKVALGGRPLRTRLRVRARTFQGPGRGRA